MQLVPSRGSSASADWVEILVTPVKGGGDNVMCEMLFMGLCVVSFLGLKGIEGS